MHDSRNYNGDWSAEPHNFLKVIVYIFQPNRVVLENRSFICELAANGVFYPFVKLHDGWGRTIIQFERENAMQIRIKREVPEIQEKSFEPIGCSKKEAARLLGVSISTVHSMTKSGKLPCKRIGRRVIYSVKALREFLNTIDVPKNCEIDGSTDER